MRSLQASAFERLADGTAERQTSIESSAPVGRYRTLATRIAALTVYGIAFTLLRSGAAKWATHGLFSVWFPAAGLRFAFLWMTGPRWAPAAAIAELLVSVGAGTVELQRDILLGLLGVIGPCLVYGAVIGLIQNRTRRSSAPDEFDPSAFAIAAVLGPMAACLAALPWAIPLSLQSGTFEPMLLASALLVFTLGDLLGILVVAPPLLWLIHRMRFGQASTKSRLRSRQFAGLILLYACAWALVWLLVRLGDGLVLAPVLLAACWCGLRCGRVAAWTAIVTTTLILLPLTGGVMTDSVRIQVHMQLACVAVGAYLAGSYADAQAQAKSEISRRDRLLLRADRLKSLRAMSVAVIHEVSQPLSTIAIEARALVEAAASGRTDRSEIRDFAKLIARKADDLADLIRRLRSFGSGSHESRSMQSIPQLVADVLSLAEPEAKQASVSIVVPGGPEATAYVHDIEMRQALLNLVRNAISAAPKPRGIVSVGWSQSDSSTRIWVENAVGSGTPSRRGMGLGLIITRTIAQAHGGRLTIDRTAAGVVRAILHVPVRERVLP